MTEKIALELTLPVLPEKVIAVWLDPKLHERVTGGSYTIDPVPGGAFSAWDGYILGSILDLDPPGKVRMHWRAAEFPADAPDSLLELVLTVEKNGTHLKLTQEGIPAGLGETYRQGWLDNYLDPLRDYFHNPNKEDL